MIKRCMVKLNLLMTPCLLLPKTTDKNTGALKISVNKNPLTSLTPMLIRFSKFNKNKLRNLLPIKKEKLNY